MTSDLRITACRSCVQPIIWTLTQRGKKMPVDAEPDPLGTFILEFRDGDEPTSVYVGNRDTDDDRYTSHFSTCPHADKHRKPKEVSMR